MDQQRFQEQFSRFQAVCRKAGLTLPHQCLEIYRELADSIDHPSAEALYQRLIGRIPTLSLDTGYRTLAMFARHGLVHKVETGEREARFEVIAERHHHLICRHCFEIIDFCWKRWMRSRSRRNSKYGAKSKIRMSLPMRSAGNA